MLDVLIVGAGLSGVGMACHLQRRCPWARYAILEAREASGGTWDLFRYPGVRSDSDMFTLGYAFRPWVESKAIADGPSILGYIRETAQEYGVDKQVTYRTKVVSASFDSKSGQWSVEAEREGTRVRYACRFLMMCSGYYRYDRGYFPDFPGLESFAGRVVHPQFWPRDFDYAGKRVLVIGSGATAVTIVPEMAKTAAEVTMLQRSPTYMVSRPSADAFANSLRARLPARLAYALTRVKNVLLYMTIYRRVRKHPEEAKKRLIEMASADLGPETDLADFTPRYAPWDQRLCLVPDADFFHAVRDKRAKVVTDEIDAFAPTGVRLKSGRTLDADILVIATGLELNLLGDVAFDVDGERVDFSQRRIYKGCMYEGAPNLASVFGYTNSSWTLKADLIAGYVCRLMNHMRKRGLAVATPGPATGEPALPFMNLTSGYVQRAVDRLPKQGAKAPWRMNQNYAKDVELLRFGRIDDGVLIFAKALKSASSDAINMPGMEVRNAHNTGARR
jgi:cation diffusion facilitator CzcD-associated flavoprotein CzcO